MKNFIKKYVKVPTKLQCKRGATMVEYALIVGVISVAAVASLPIIKNKVSAAFSTTANSLN
jgi:Flp pilus assembly pilin Flp